jgi:FkbM family methyltransferase
MARRALPDEIAVRPPIRRNGVRLLTRRLLWEFRRRTAGEALYSSRRVRLPWGVTLEIIPFDIVELSLYLNGIHEFTATNIFLAQLEPGMNVLDVGAHIGQFSVLASRAVGPRGRVMALEPVAATFERLRKNLKLNHCDNVHAINVGASEKRSVVPVYLPRDRNTSAASLQRERYSGDPLMSEVSVATIDELCAGMTFDVVKIDIEGHEAAALRGARELLTRSRPVIVVELNDVDESGGSPTTELLRDHGYEIYEMARWRLTKIARGERVDRMRARMPALNVIALHPGRG